MRRSSSDSSVESQSHVATRPTKKTRPSPIQTDGIATADAHRFKVKVPPFSPDEPEIWFALLEGQFTQYGIQDDAVRYTHVITNLDILHAKAVKDIIVNPPERHRYGKIKTELIRRLSDSHERKIKQLLTHEELGDRKPSQFLRHLKDLAGPSVPNDFIKTIWCQRLPSNVQAVLASQPTLSAEQLADLADNILEIVTPSHVAMTSHHASGHTSEIAELKKMVEQLALKVENSQASQGYAGRSRSRRRPPSHYRSGSYQRHTSRSRSSDNYRKHRLCWYHYRFGNDAQKCVKPCNHAGKV